MGPVFDTDAIGADRDDAVVLITLCPCSRSKPGPQIITGLSVRHRTGYRGHGKEKSRCNGHTECDQSRLAQPPSLADQQPPSNPKSSHEAGVYTLSVYSCHMAHTAQLILGLVEEGPTHGYGLKQRHDHHFQRARPLHVGQIYSTLGRLERDGLVRPAGVEHRAGPDRKLYAITTEGSKATEEWLATPEAPAPHLHPVLYSKVVLSLLTNRDPAIYLDAQRAVHLRRMRELTAIKRSGGLVDKLLADHALFHLEADLRWIDLAADRVEDLANEVSP